MKKKHVKQSIEELAKGLQAIYRVKPNLSDITLNIMYSGEAFTLAVATITIPNSSGNKSKVIIGEGICKRGFEDDKSDEIRSYNIAGSRALEAIDKKLRRANKYIGHKYEG